MDFVCKKTFNYSCVRSSQTSRQVDIQNLVSNCKKLLIPLQNLYFEMGILSHGGQMYFYDHIQNGQRECGF